MLYPVKAICKIDDPNGEPCFEIPLKEILATLDMGWALQVLKPKEYHTARQRAWYKGVLLPYLFDQTGHSKAWWDHEIKKHCEGLALLKKEILLTDNGTPLGRLTIVGVGKKNMTEFINNIIDKNTDETFKEKHDWPYIPPPDSELRK